MGFQWQAARILRLFQGLCGAFFEQIDALLADADAAGRLDFLIQKALFAVRYGCVQNVENVKDFEAGFIKFMDKHSILPNAQNSALSKKNEQMENSVMELKNLNFKLEEIIESFNKLNSEE